LPSSPFNIRAGLSDWPGGHSPGREATTNATKSSHIDNSKTPDYIASSMPRTLLFIILLHFSYFSVAQKETSHWFLSGNHLKIDKSSITNATAASLNPSHSTTSVSDSAGNLLFASDGKTVIDRNLNPMPAVSSSPLSGNGKVLATRIPNSNRYYLFYSRPLSSNPNSLAIIYYSIIDLSVNGGMGDVISMNQVIDTLASPAFTLAEGSTEDEAWLILHRHGTRDFLSYKITATGMAAAPVPSTAGTYSSLDNYIFHDLKTSPNGKMIAGLAYRNYTINFAYTRHFYEVYNWDPATGMLSYKIRSKWSGVYFHHFISLEFSPDNRLLYGGLMERIYGLQPCGYGAGSIMQFNLCYTDSTEFSRYAMRIGYAFNWCNPGLSWGRLQLGADKKIHVPFTGFSLSAINNPNRIGSWANMDVNGYTQPNNNNGNVSSAGFYHLPLRKAVINNIVYEGNCFPNPISFRITNDTINNISWNFGDPASASNTSSQTKPQHVFSVPGIYTVKASLFSSSGNLIDTLSELIEIKDPAKRLLYGWPVDTSICAGRAFTIKLNVVNGIFVWKKRHPDGYLTQTGQVGDSIMLDSEGTYIVEMRQNDCNGCILTDSIRLHVNPIPPVNLGPNRNLCTGDSLKLSVSDPAAKYTWSTGDTTQSIWAKQGGTYWVEGEYNGNGCPVRDSITITAVPGVSFSLPNDTTLCNDQSLLLNPGISPANYQWQNGSSSPTLTVTSPGTYWVRVWNANCFRRDTIMVAYINAMQVNLGNDSTLCLGDSLRLQPNIPGGQFLWSDGSTNTHLMIKHSGSYWVRISNAVCSVTDTISVTFSTPPKVSLGNDTSLCINEKIVLRSPVTSATYQWSDLSIKDSLEVNTAGLYHLTVNQGGCTVKDSINIYYKSLPVVDLGANRGTCEGQSIVLYATDPSIQSLQWQDGTTQPNFTATTTGLYHVQVQGWNGCKSNDSVQLNFQPLPIFSIGPDTSICEGASLNYQFTLPSASYVWNNGQTTPNSTLTQPGIHWLQVTQSGCSRRDSITLSVNPLPSVQLGKDTSLCEGTSTVLNAFHPGANYVWNDGSSSASMQVKAPGLYWVKVTANACSRADSIQVLYKYGPQFKFGADTMLCNGQSFVLDPGLSSGNFLWQDGSTDRVFEVQQPGLYKLTVINECGSKSDEIQVTKGNCVLSMPDAFTPNNDGLNDIFRVKYPQFIKTFRMRIFNRWGQIIYETTDPLRGWDGRFQGALLPTANFIWIINLTDLNGNTSVSHGNVILIR
jgi:gliding motility-associated-like protein